MPYLTRDLESRVLTLSEEYACLLLTGSRQVGKTTMLRHLDGVRHYVTLDDLEERRLAKTEPSMFLALHPAPVLIDEVQYAPELFSYIKMAVDGGAEPGSFWLTGSQAFHLMELAQESLAGRTAVLHLPALSQHEIYGRGVNEPFSVALSDLQRRVSTGTPTNMSGLYERIWRGAMPGLISGAHADRDMFYGSYLATYLGHDVADLLERADKLLFKDFIRAAACRAGQMLNVHSIAGDVGIADHTARRWLGILEVSDVIFYLRPYANNLLKRTIKQPKLYFFDTGLVSYLTGYLSADILAKGAMSGAILENYVIAEIRKSFYNAGHEGVLWYYRDKDGAEIDIVLFSDGVLHPIEIKRTANPGTAMIRSFARLDRGEIPRGAGAIICLREQLSAIDAQNVIVPVWIL